MPITYQPVARLQEGRLVALRLPSCVGRKAADVKGTLTHLDDVLCIAGAMNPGGRAEGRCCYCARPAAQTVPDWEFKGDCRFDNLRCSGDCLGPREYPSPGTPTMFCPAHGKVAGTSVQAPSVPHGAARPLPLLSAPMVGGNRSCRSRGSGYPWTSCTPVDPEARTETRQHPISKRDFAIDGRPREHAA